MWYFSWVLGLALACCFAILNAMWFELQENGKETLVIEKKNKTPVAKVKKASKVGA